MLKEGLSIDTTFNPPQFSSDYTFKHDIRLQYIATVNYYIFFWGGVMVSNE